MLILVSALTYWLFHIQDETPFLGKIQKTAQNIFTNDSVKTKTTDSTQTAPAPAETTKAPMKISDEQFSAWISTEVKNIEIPNNDQVSVERKTKEFVNQLSEAQIEQLKQKILNSELPINERIFANYALTLFDGEGSNENLYNTITHPVPKFNNVQVHSADEIKRGQEYSLKITLIDELAKRTEAGDSRSLQYLTQIAQINSDLKIQNYAKRKLQEIKH